MLKEELRNEFLEFGLKESSAKSYSNIIYTIIKKLDVNPSELKGKVSDWFTLEKFNNKFKGLKHSTSRNYISAVVALMKVRDEVDTKLYKELSIDVVEHNSFYQKLATSGKLSEMEQRLWVEPEKLGEVYSKNLKPMLSGYPLNSFSKKKPLSFNEVQSVTVKHVMDAVITSIYLYPFADPKKVMGILRNDVGSLHFYNQGRKKTPPGKDIDEKKNYYIQTSGGGYILLNDYKTSKTHGSSKIPISDEVNSILKAWSAFMELENQELLFDGVSKTDITTILQKVTKKYTGKAIGSQMIRKIFLTGLYGEDKKEQERIAKSMGHSTEMQQDLYVKDV